MALLEIIATSVADAIAAEQSGADRIELISHFECGGLTPALRLVREVVNAVKIPVRVMVRETENFYVTDKDEQNKLCSLASDLAELPIDGIVCGFLQGDEIDHHLLARVVTAAAPRNATFHRAFEQLSNPLLALRELKKYPQIDCILTSGGEGTPPQKIAALGVCERMATPEIMLLAGGGMTAETMREICANTRVRNFHFGTFVREPQNINGAVNPARVRFVRGILKLGEV